MSDALDHADAAIREVTQARLRVKKGTNRQVRSLDELDQLRSLASTWFRTHRPRIAAALPTTDLTHADTAFQVIMDSTSRSAARATYVAALEDSKQALLILRHAAASTPSVQAARRATLHPDPAPDFSALAHDRRMQDILNNRWEEIQRCISVDANLAGTVMMGGLLETLLVARINRTKNKQPIFTAKTAPRDKQGATRPLADWKLADMVAVAHEVGWITKSAKDVGNVLRDFRNYIHPHKEHVDGIVIANDDVRLFWDLCKAMSHQLLKSV